MEATDRLFLLICLVFRFVNAFILHNSFAPDEHWQSSEVAHWLVFGYGYLTWEWESCVALRGILHPLLIAGLYWILQWLHIDTRWMVAYGPRIFIGSPVAAGVDMGVYKLSKLWFGPDIGQLAFVFSLFSWFNFYCLTRTYSNCIEALCNIWGIYWWSRARWEGVTTTTLGLTQHARPKFRSLCVSLFLASLGIAIRPTSMVLWIVLFYGSTVLEFLAAIRRMSCSIISLFLFDLMLYTLTLPVIPGFCLIFLDRPFYGYWKFPLLNFTSFNLFGDPGKFYGRGDWHYYLGEGSALVFLSFFPFIIAAVFILGRSSLDFFISRSEEANPEIRHDDDRDNKQQVLPTVTLTQRKQKKEVADSTQNIGSPQKKQQQQKIKNPPVFDIACVFISMVCNLIMLSNSTHKEHRLLVPFIPLLLPLGAYGFWYLCIRPSGKKVEGSNQSVSKTQFFWLAVILGIQVLTVLISSLGYLVGGERTMDLLHNHLQHLQPNESKTIYFLNPCHQLPFYSFIHDPDVRMGFLDCSPQIRRLPALQHDDRVATNTPYHDSWRRRFWENPINVMNELFPSTESDKHAAFDAYMNPQLQLQQPRGRRAIWFGGLGSLLSNTTERIDAKNREVSVLKARSRLLDPECLDYRFELPLQVRELPTFLVVPSALFQVSPHAVEWFVSRNYRLENSIFDSLIADHPKDGMGMEYMPRIFIYKRSPSVSLIATSEFLVPGVIL